MLQSLERSRFALAFFPKMSYDEVTCVSHTLSLSQKLFSKELNNYKRNLLSPGANFLANTHYVLFFLASAVYIIIVSYLQVRMSSM